MAKNLQHILIERYGVSEEAYKDCISSMAETGEGLVKTLVDSSVISEYQLLEAMSLKYGIPFLPELPISNIRQDLLKDVSIQFLKKNVMIHGLLIIINV